MRSPERKLSILLAIALGGAGASVPISVRLISDALKPKSLAQASEIIPATATSIAPTKTATLKAEFTVTPIATTSPAAESTATAITTPPPTETPKLIDPNPRLIPAGELPNNSEPSTIETMAKEAKGETGYKKLVLSLVFSDPGSVSFESVDLNPDTWWRVKFDGKTEFRSFVNAPVISYERYSRLNAEDRLKSWIVAPTSNELAEMRKKSPNVGPIVRIIVPGEGDIMYLELVLSPAPNTKVESSLKPGDSVQLDTPLETLDGEFALTVFSQYTNGKIIPSTADFRSFVQIGNKVGLPAENFKDSK